MKYRDNITEKFNNNNRDGKSCFKFCSILLFRMLSSNLSKKTFTNITAVILGFPFSIMLYVECS